MKYLFAILLTTIFFSCRQKDDTPQAANQENISNILGPSRNAEFSSVTQEHGELQVSEGVFSSESTITPWSSWWYPNNKRLMFDLEGDELSPLEKYDAFIEKKFKVSSLSASFEEKEIYDPLEVAWSGLCHAWAIASVLHPEPLNSIKKNSITFSPTDQKALLMKSYENVSGLKMYGQRNNGQHAQNYEDIYPDQFHRFIQVYLFEKKLPFLMDYDASFPVWTVPVFVARFEVKFESEYSVIVKTWLTMASPFVDSSSFIGTKRVAKYYEYRLYGQWKNKIFLVSNGEWINDSRYDHPDYIIAYPENPIRASLNKEITIEGIDLIVGK